MNRRLRAVNSHGIGPILVGLAAAVLFFDAWEMTAQLDDAFISYRYAVNLVEGNGLVFNIGQRVEGFTNLLWTLLVALGVLSGFDAPAVGHVLGLASGAAAFIATFALARAIVSDTAEPTRSWIAAAPAWIVLANTAFVRWSVSGMETVAFAAFVTAALAAFARNRISWATFFVCLATLTRPEGVIVAGILFAFHLLAHFREGYRAWTCPIAYAAMVGALTIFRFMYYGDILPNTFYVKVPGVPLAFGIEYWLGFAREIAVFMAFPAALAVWRDPKSWPSAVLILMLSIYVVSIGGDAFGHSRHLIVLLPCLAVLAVRGTQIAFDSNRLLGACAALCIVAGMHWQVFGSPSWAAGVVYLVLMAAALLPPSFAHRIWLRGAAVLVAIAICAVSYGHLTAAASGFDPSRREELLRSAQRIDRRQEHLAQVRVRKLRERGATVRLVAATGIGSFGYHSGLPILDILGLVDRTIARSTLKKDAEGFEIPGHARSNANHVFSHRPDYILVPKKGTEGALKAHFEIWNHPDFDLHYRWDPPLGYRRDSDR